MKDDKNKKIGLSKILFYALILLPIAVCIWGIAQGESLAAAIQRFFTISRAFFKVWDLPD